MWWFWSSEHANERVASIPRVNRKIGQKVKIQQNRFGLRQIIARSLFIELNSFQSLLVFYYLQNIHIRFFFTISSVDQMDLSKMIRSDNSYSKSTCPPKHLLLQEQSYFIHLIMTNSYEFFFAIYRIKWHRVEGSFGKCLRVWYSTRIFRILLCLHESYTSEAQITYIGTWECINSRLNRMPFLCLFFKHVIF